MIHHVGAHVWRVVEEHKERVVVGRRERGLDLERVLHAGRLALLRSQMGEKEIQFCGIRNENGKVSQEIEAQARSEYQERPTYHSCSSCAACTGFDRPRTPLGDQGCCARTDGAMWTGTG